MNSLYGLWNRADPRRHSPRFVRFPFHFHYGRLHAHPFHPLLIYTFIVTTRQRAIIEFLDFHSFLFFLFVCTFSKPFDNVLFDPVRDRCLPYNGIHTGCAYKVRCRIQTLYKASVVFFFCCFSFLTGRRKTQFDSVINFFHNLKALIKSRFILINKILFSTKIKWSCFNVESINLLIWCHLHDRIGTE